MRVLARMPDSDARAIPHAGPQPVIQVSAAQVRVQPAADVALTLDRSEYGDIGGSYDVI